MKKIAITTILLLAVSCFISAQDFFDDFESYNVGEQLVVQNPDDWTTWSNSPGSVEDPYIQNIGSNVVNITGVNDLVHVMPNWTTGYFEIIFDIYILEGGDGYFNTLQEFSPTPTWGMQVYFGHTNYGEGNIDGGAALAQIFTFEYDTWMSVKITVDLENDWGEFYLDDVMIHAWIWSTGTFGTGTLNQLGGSNFYAWDGGVYAQPLFYIDNYEFDDSGFNPSGIPQNVTAELISDTDVKVDWDPPEGYSEELLGYNVYKNGEFMTFIEDPITEYYEYDLEPDTYEYCVTAIHDWGESWQVCADEVYIIDPTPPGPSNLTGPDWVPWWMPYVNLTWDAPGSPQWIRWDAGTNDGNGIGLTNGGTFSVASHWFPEDLIPFNGYQLLEIAFYANGDPNAIYTIKVWTGTNGTNEVHSQEVTSFNVDDWNNVVLTPPVPINATTDLWFGYEVTHEAGTNPAGCDDGPAVQYHGDMISTGGGWVSMSVEYGLDYNWNIAGLIGLANGKVSEPQIKDVQLPDSDNDFVACGSNGTYNKFIPGGIKDLEYYNLYRKDPGATYFYVICATTDTEYVDILDEIGMHQYYVTAVWDPEGESDPSNIWVVDVMPGIEEEIIHNTFIYPIPASDVIRIKSDFEIVSLKVYNLTGQVLTKEEVNNNNYELVVSHLNPGIYFLQVEFEEDQVLRKIVVE